MLFCSGPVGIHQQYAIIIEAFLHHVLYGVFGNDKEPGQTDDSIGIVVIIDTFVKFSCDGEGVRALFLSIKPGDVDGCAYFKGLSQHLLGGVI